MEDWYVSRDQSLGSSITNPGTPEAKINYLSVSQLEKFDPTAYGGCNRRWWFRYIKKIDEPQTKAQQAGTEGHAKLEHFQKTGELVLGDLERAMARYAGPSKNALIEHHFNGELDAAGVPFVGYIDRVDTGGIYIGTDGEPYEEPGTIELLDWKFTSDLKWAKSGAELANTIQMIGYAEWARRVLDAPRFRLSHVYGQFRSSIAEKKTCLVDAETVKGRWSRVEGLAAQMIEIAKLADSKDVEPNYGSCAAYKGCPHKALCPRSPEQVIRDTFGNSLLQALGKTVAQSQTICDGGKSMSLLAKLSATTTIAPGKNGTPAVPQTPPPLANAAPPAAPSKALEKAPDFDYENAMCVKCAIKVKLIPSTGEARWWHDPGTCSVADGPLKRGGVCPYKAKSEVIVVVLPPDAAKPGQSGPIAEPIPPETLLPLPEKIRQASAELAANLAASPPTEAPKKRGRSKKSESSSMTSTAIVSPTTTDGICLYADVVIEGLETSPLEPYIEQICAALAQEYNAADLRCAPSDGALSYGKWRGALAACVRVKPPEPGVYSLMHVAESEFKQVVLEALRPVCSVLVRGVR